MSQVLLDTHAFLWFVFDDPRISDRAARLLADTRTGKILSIASLWEIAIKLQLKKLSLGMRLDVFCDRFVRGAQLEVLDIELHHLLAYEKLPLHHRDPFDRLLVAQAQALGVPRVTSDAAFRSYAVKTVW